VEFDLLVRGGIVLDGTGGTPVRVDVGVLGGRVAEVGRLAAATAGTVVDATGLVVSPGFIDAHTHSDLVPFYPEEFGDVAAASVRQGVTTEVPGNCGLSPFPRHRGPGDDPALGIWPAAARRAFASVAAFRSAADERGSMLVNLAPLVGHGTLRSAVLGEEGRPATAEEVASVCRLTEQAMDEGAFGVSTGLIYAPGIYAETDELVAVATVAGRHGRPYTSHMRDEGDRVELSVAETLQIGRTSGAPVQISHHKVTGRRNWGRSAETLRMIGDARAAGVDVLLDYYPYTAGCTMLQALLPPWLLAAGPEPAVTALAERSVLDRLRVDYGEERSSWQNFPGLLGWDKIVAAGAGSGAGRSIAELAAAGPGDEVDALARVLLADPDTTCFVHGMDEREVAVIGAQPFAMVGSDGDPVEGMQHPRTAGTFAKVLAGAGGDLTVLTDVVRRATSLPADRFGLAGRGRLTRGAVADLVVFDARRVRDRSTYTEGLLPPVGVPHVVVAGEPVVRDGVLTGARPGRVLAAG